VDRQAACNAEPGPRRVEDVYRPCAVTIATDQRLQEAAVRMAEEDIGALVVVDGGRVLGILSERDLVRAAADRAGFAWTCAAEYVTPEPATTTLDADLHQVAAVMRKLQIRHLPVVDGGEVVGMVSARDVLELEAGTAAGVD